MFSKSEMNEFRELTRNMSHRVDEDGIVRFYNINGVEEYTFSCEELVNYWREYE